MTKRERTTINLPDDLKRQARSKAILEDKNLSEVVRALLAAWVEGKIELPKEQRDT